MNNHCSIKVAESVVRIGRGREDLFAMRLVVGDMLAKFLGRPPKSKEGKTIKVKMVLIELKNYLTKLFFYKFGLYKTVPKN